MKNPAPAQAWEKHFQFPQINDKQKVKPPVGGLGVNQRFEIPNLDLINDMSCIIKTDEVLTFTRIASDIDSYCFYQEILLNCQGIEFDCR